MQHYDDVILIMYTYTLLGLPNFTDASSTSTTAINASIPILIHRSIQQCTIILFKYNNGIDTSVSYFTDFDITILIQISELV